jgi:hypothetical protein
MRPLLSPLLSNALFGNPSGHSRWSEMVVRGRVELPTFRFSGGFASPGASTMRQLTGPYDALAPVGVQDQPHVSGGRC